MAKGYAYNYVYNMWYPIPMATNATNCKNCVTKGQRM